MRGTRAGNRRRSTTAPVLRDPWILALVAFGTACSAVFLLHSGGYVFTARFMWVTQVPLDAAFFWFSWRAARVPGIDRLVVRYMVALSFAGFLFLLGDLTQVAITVWRPSVQAINGSAPQSAFFLVGCTVLGWTVTLTSPVRVSHAMSTRLLAFGSVDGPRLSPYSW